MNISNPMIAKLHEEATLGQMLENRATFVGDRTAIIFRDKSWTYDQFNRAVDRLATGLLDLGVTREDRIAIIMPTRPEFLLMWFAAAKIGCSVVGLNFRYKREEVIYMVNEAKPRFMFCINSFAETDYAEFFNDIRDRINSLATFIFLGETSFAGGVDFESLVQTPADPARLAAAREGVDPAADHFIIFTSGSTGKPKGAVLTQKSIMAMLRPWAANLELTENDRMLDVLPLNHVGGGTLCAMGPLGSGATLVLHDVFDPVEAMDLIPRLGITSFGGVPTLFAMLFSHPEFNKQKLAGLQLIVYGGSAAPAKLLKAMEVHTSASIMACYGSTEVSGFCTYTARRDPVNKVMDNTAGRAPEGIDLIIVEPFKRTPVGQGQVGEVAIRGDLLIDRYLNAPDLTAQSFDKNGWFYTGDMGYLDPDGFLVLVGRYKEMYICGGYNVYPKEIEDTLVQHTGVAMAAVIGMPHEKMGEVGWAYVMKRPGSNLDAEELLSLCKQNLADYKVPARIIIKDVFPMTALGKIHKPSLQEEASKEL